MTEKRALAPSPMPKCVLGCAHYLKKLFGETKYLHFGPYMEKDRDNECYVVFSSLPDETHQYPIVARFYHEKNARFFRAVCEYFSNYDAELVAELKVGTSCTTTRERETKND